MLVPRSLVVARFTKVSRGAIDRWQAGLRAYDCDPILQPDALIARTVLKYRGPLGILIDGVDDYQLAEKLRFTRIACNCGHHDNRVVFLLPSGDTLGLSDGDSLCLHFPSQPMDIYYQYLAWVANRQDVYDHRGPLILA